MVSDVRSVRVGAPKLSQGAPKLSQCAPSLSQGAPKVSQGAPLFSGTATSSISQLQALTTGIYVVFKS